ncbi:hypothetical protein ACFLYD_03615 [Chloroflexota bacterium]
MIHNRGSTPPNDEHTIVVGNCLAGLSTLFIPDIEDDEWRWWPASHNFYEEWDSGALMEIALDSAFRSAAADLPLESLEQAVAAAEEGLGILAGLELDEPVLPFRVLLTSRADEALKDFEDLAGVLAGCFDLGDLLTQERPETRTETIAGELYGASDDWAIPLVFGLVRLKLHLLGPAFQAAMQGWYEQLLVRAKAHYLHDAQVVP